ncbi:TetR/AcrR family transcriptional regulator [Nannocystis sp. ILAH1]|uniref:TetR/AcrR family transcriptional regulator n=1 Tax=unclassified Nannocystis TaxID=2627009 RepID=UPI00226E967C|nr:MULTISPECIES: TetR/AcrR family transcriptional regulator [unclassified Nannocystis]MCY0994815.1 TetR/AcrR family transcriptional regulator [Nannocystis sp. ILAH1]MCY1065357.1 TetR/AcrR family transcriptional regulator [Nannocystis sp. RBIL2]
MTRVQDDTAADPRRARLLEAALTTFMHFGYRKTSMEEVARAAQVSRQALYLHFSTKEGLFRDAVRHTLATGLERASALLQDCARTCEDRLSGAFDVWVGRHVGFLGTDVTDLEEARDLLVAPMVSEYDERFSDTVTRAIRAAGLAAAYKPAGLTARQLADILYATARGFKHRCSSPEEFSRHFGAAVRAMCLPLRTRG